MPPPPPPAAPPPAAAAPAPPALTEPPPPPPRETDLRPIRERRRFFIGGELGWNGLSGLGANFSFHPIPYFAIDAGLGLSITGLRAGVRARANFLKSEWTPFAGLGLSYAAGSGDQAVDAQWGDEKTKLIVKPSPFAQLGAGVNYTGTEGFVFMGTVGYAILLRNKNTKFAGDAASAAQLDAYDHARDLYKGGVIISVAFGYAF